MMKLLGACWIRLEVQLQASRITNHILNLDTTGIRVNLNANSSSDVQNADFFSAGPIRLRHIV